jgi:hypothetical protein
VLAELEKGKGGGDHKKHSSPGCEQCLPPGRRRRGDRQGSRGALAAGGCRIRRDILRLHPNRSHIDKGSKESRDRRIFDMWMACYTQEEIAENSGCDQDTVSAIVRKSAELPESVKPAASHLVDFDPPIYNIWKQQLPRCASC